MNDLKLYTTKEVCELFGISKMQVYRLMDRGLKSIKIGKSRRFRASDLEEFIEMNQKKTEEN